MRTCLGEVAEGLALFSYAYLKATLRLPEPAELSGQLRLDELNSAL